MSDDEKAPVSALSPKRLRTAGIVASVIGLLAALVGLVGLLAGGLDVFYVLSTALGLLLSVFGLRGLRRARAA